MISQSMQQSTFLGTRTSELLLFHHHLCSIVHWNGSIF